MQRNGECDSRGGAPPSAAVMPTINQSEVPRPGERGNMAMPRSIRAANARRQSSIARQRASIAFSDFSRSLPAAFSAAASSGGSGASE